MKEFEVFEKFINYCDEHKVPYELTKYNGREFMYVYNSKRYKLKSTKPRKYKDLYVPYIRISSHDGRWYVRDNGWCDYMPESVIFESIEKQEEVY